MQLSVSAFSTQLIKYCMSILTELYISGLASSALLGSEDIEMHNASQAWILTPLFWYFTSRHNRPGST